MEKIMEQFGVQPILLLAQAVNFFILLWILKKFLYRPLLQVLEKRRQTIEDGIKNAEEIELKLAKTEQDYQKKIDIASTEARKIVDQATKSASEIVNQAHLKAAQDLQDILKKGRDSIEGEKDRMYSQMRSELTTLVITTLEQVTGKVLSKKDQVDIIEKTVKKL